MRPHRIPFLLQFILSSSSGATIKRHSTLCIHRVNHLIDHIAIHSIYSRIQKYENKLHTLWIFSQRWNKKDSSGEHKYTAQLNIFQQIPIILLIFLTPHSLCRSLDGIKFIVISHTLLFCSLIQLKIIIENLNPIKSNKSA